MDVEKPLSVKRDDFINDLLTLINESGLDMYIIHPILLDVTASIEEHCRSRAEQERKQYELALNEKAREENGRESTDKVSAG